MKQVKYDVIVVGAGPAGSLAAIHAAKGGAKTLLLEKDRDIGYPVRCAEGVSHIGLTNYVALDPRWIRSTIKDAILIAPDSTQVPVATNNEMGYIIDRRIFDYDLAMLAAKEGVEVQTKAYVYDLLKAENGAVTGVKLDYMGKKLEIASKIVIGADGVESRVGRWAGLHTAVKIKDMESCAQFTVAGINVDPGKILFYFGESWAPGGYLWVFPKGNNLANIGLGVNGERTGLGCALDLLSKFLKNHYPEASILTTVAGGVPVAKTLKRITTDGLLLVGDAARTVNPISGGGIATGMLSGKLAGEIAAEAIEKGDFSNSYLENYSKKWSKAQGKNHERLYRVKEVIFRLTDEELNSLAAKVINIPVSERTLLRIFKTLFMNRPALMKDILLAIAGL